MGTYEKVGKNNIIVVVFKWNNACVLCCWRIVKKADVNAPEHYEEKSEK